MLKIKRNITSLLIALVILSSCSGYQKLLKSSDTNLKYEKAMEYFNKGDYHRASTLFENLLPYVRGTDLAELTNFHHAESYYRSGDYILAGYYFRNFAGTFPNSPRLEDVSFKSAYCYYLDSPKYSLDQSNTYDAIDEFQFFINKYPNSPKIEECNKFIDQLRGKLEKKSFKNSELYYNVGDYQAATIALMNTLEDYPDTNYREEILYLVFKSHYIFAKKSIASKQKERYKKAVEAYFPLVDQFPESKYKKEVDKLYKNAVEELERIGSADISSK